MNGDTVTAEELAELRAIADEAATMDRRLIDVGVLMRQLESVGAGSGFSVAVPVWEIVAKLRKALA